MTDKDDPDASDDTDADARDDPDASDDTDAGESPPAGLPDGIPDPDAPPDLESDPHVLPEEELVYPTFAFERGELDFEEGFALRRSLDRETMQSWLADLAGGLGSHDVAIEGERRRGIFGVAPDDVQVSFDPGEGTRGTLSVTVSLDAALLRLEDADERPLGARGGRGFIPLAMLTGDRDPDEFRCYNWVDDPTEGDVADAPGDDDGQERDETAVDSEEDSTTDGAASGQ